MIEEIIADSNLPKSCKIGNHNIKIIYKDKVVDQDNKELYGILYPDDNILEINKSESLYRMKHSILHMFIRCIEEEEFQYTLTKTHVDILADRLIENIRENKELFNWIFNKETK